MSLDDRLRRLLSHEAGSDPEGGEVEDLSAVCDDPECVDAMSRIQEFLDGELEDTSHEEVAHHFHVCQKCYPHLRLEERFRDLLHRYHAEECAPQHLRDRVLELLARESDRAG